MQPIELIIQTKQYKVNIPISQSKKEVNNIQYKNKQTQLTSYELKNPFSKNTDKIPLNENQIVSDKIYQNNIPSLIQNKLYQLNQDFVKNTQNFENNFNNYNNIIDKKIMDYNSNRNQYFNYTNKTNYNQNISNNVNILPTSYNTEQLNPIIEDNEVSYLPLMTSPIQYTYYTTEPNINNETLYYNYNNINCNESYFGENSNNYTNNNY